ncbi:MAG TPA: LamG domain-containing protein [Candidatus Krumholzibacteria bacterium]|nr:LamG domain-containing protein [Candidatus Krumholzibacteria bacterium]
MKYSSLLVTSLLVAVCAGCGDDDPTPAAPAAPTAPRSGLVAEYLFNGNANDSEGSNHGTLVGGPTLRSDRFGRADRAYTLDGVDDHITTTNDSFRSGNNVSVSLWFRVPSTAAGLAFSLMCSDFATGTSGANASIAISIPSTDNAAGAFTTANEWHHLLGTYDGIDIRCYINGVLAETTNHPGNISDPDRPLTVGRFNTTYWAGDIDDVRIYNRVISDAGEISNLYHEGGYAQ